MSTESVTESDTNSDSAEFDRKCPIYSSLSPKMSRFFTWMEIPLMFTVGLMIIIHSTVEIIPFLQAYSQNYLPAFTAQILVIKGVFFVIAYIAVIPQNLDFGKKVVIEKKKNIELVKVLTNSSSFGTRF